MHRYKKLPSEWAGVNCHKNVLFTHMNVLLGAKTEMLAADESKVFFFFFFFY